MRCVTMTMLALPLMAAVGTRDSSTVKRTNRLTLSKATGSTHVVEVIGGRTLYVSGRVALDQAGAVVGKVVLKAPTRQVPEVGLTASGATFDDVVPR